MSSSDHDELTANPPGLRLVEHEFSVPLDHARPDGERITVFAREVADPEGLRAAAARLPAGRARPRGAAPDAQPEQPRLAGSRAEGLPRADARPARHGPLEPDRRARGDDAGRAGVLPDALPCRLDRPRRGVDPPRARRRALERARPELRRDVRRQLPLAGARGAARGVHHRRAAAVRRAHRRCLPRDVRVDDRRLRALLRALPAGPRARARARRAPGVRASCACRAAIA